MKPRAVARAIPGALRVIPLHHAAHVRAHGRESRERTVLVAIDGRAIAVKPQDASLAACHRTHTLSLAALEPVLCEVVWVIEVLLEVIPSAAAYVLSSRIEEISPRI